MINRMNWRSKLNRNCMLMYDWIVDHVTVSQKSKKTVS